MEILIPYGWKNNKLLHIDEVERGLDCECICPSCKTPLEACKGEKRKYFRHHTIKNCEGALESTLHILAKKMISEKKKFFFYFNNEKNEIKFDKVIEEFQNFKEFKPDCLGITQDQEKIVIEIFVKHICGKEKIERMQALGLRAFEIDLNISKVKSNKFEDYEKYLYKTIFEDPINTKQISFSISELIFEKENNLLKINELEKQINEKNQQLQNFVIRLERLNELETERNDLKNLIFSKKEIEKEAIKLFENYKKQKIKNEEIDKQIKENTEKLRKFQNLPKEKLKIVYEQLDSKFQNQLDQYQRKISILKTELISHRLKIDNIKQDLENIEAEKEEKYLKIEHEIQQKQKSLEEIKREYTKRYNDINKLARLKGIYDSK